MGYIEEVGGVGLLQCRRKGQRLDAADTCLARVEEEATTTTTIWGQGGQYGQCCRHGGCVARFQGRGWGEFDCCGARGEDNYRSDNEEDMVVDAAKTLSNKGRRGGNNNDSNDGSGGGKMDNVVKVAAVLDESGKGRSGVNNNIHYDGVDGHQGGH
jgi:hypothetical protein